MAKKSIADLKKEIEEEKKKRERERLEKKLSELKRGGKPSKFKEKVKKKLGSVADNIMRIYK